ncbi:hypothetical protein I79_009109 [Cricetulus griseus]|uniref:Uncharacterized protein n=1 Tax=Cricetulus griseus TaxID=10029 RepID=G3HEW2_CRIGR|nr:hypothetical protein I79_009109 [Cricetulus griseus]
MLVTETETHKHTHTHIEMQISQRVILSKITILKALVHLTPSILQSHRNRSTRQLQKTGK